MHSATLVYTHAQNIKNRIGVHIIYTHVSMWGKSVFRLFNRRNKEVETVEHKDDDYFPGLPSPQLLLVDTVYVMRTAGCTILFPLDGYESACIAPMYGYERLNVKTTNIL